jgi:hypothetical protein
LDSVSYDFGAVFLLAVRPIPAPGLHASFRQNRRAFAQVLGDDFGLAAKNHNIVEVRRFLLSAIFVFPDTVGSDSDGSHLNPGWE